MSFLEKILVLARDLGPALLIGTTIGIIGIAISQVIVH